MKKGHQCFIVYPIIEESEKLDLKAATTAFDLLKDNAFKDFNIGYIDGRMKKEESHMLKHLPWVLWREWIDILSQFNVGVQLGTAAAGTFNLNCSFHGIPCIAYSNSNTQRILHPLTTVELGDIENAKHMARKLKDDKFYKLCMDTTLKRYEAYYSEDKFLENMQRIFRTLVN